ncbi:hypothetical protein P691DRAFT_801339 [Macrolepiota fuliginosa MF-IS2]|uniref:Uncharacterized protein n=1 Tax=Macrolepiota fuliginosa MF-IS2 TaxID=1400762 RepID=A0A9P5XF24_9AGAR|nr:hypothetical protein P691DRAFT_801339 [Macrolepiota fuliginosa MF-IS2]
MGTFGGFSSEYITVILLVHGYGMPSLLFAPTVIYITHLDERWLCKRIIAHSKCVARSTARMHFRTNPK